MASRLDRAACFLLRAGVAVPTRRRAPGELSGRPASGPALRTCSKTVRSDAVPNPNPIRCGSPRALGRLTYPAAPLKLQNFRKDIKILEFVPQHKNRPHKHLFAAVPER